MIKKMWNLFVVGLVIIIAGACNHKKGGTVFSNVSERNLQTIVMKNDSVKLHITYTNNTLLNTGETAIGSLEENGFVKYEKNGDSMTAERDPQGNIIYTLYQGNKKLAFDDTGRKFLSAVIREMIAYGFDARERAARIYRTQGDSVLLEAVNHIKVDNIKVIYFEQAMANPLSVKDRTTLIQLIGTLMESDYEKGKLLQRFSADSLQSEDAFQYYRKAVESIHTDFEKSNVLKYVLNQPLTDEQFAGTMSSLQTIGDDYSKAVLLKGVTDKLPATHIQWLAFIRAIGGLSSNFEKSNLLIKIAGKMPHDEQLNTVYLQAAKTITDKQQYEQAVKAGI